MTPNSLFVASSRVKSKTTAMAFTLLVILTLILTACGGGTTQQATSTAKSSTLRKHSQKLGPTLLNGQSPTTIRSTSRSRGASLLM